MSKHDLRARPVFHHTRDAIEPHLRGLQEVTINLNGHQITAQPQLTQTAAGILKSLKPSGH